MKLMVASDIHGSRYYAQKIVEAFQNENADILLLLGDIYYHGPRNPLPKDYDPMGVAKLLNAIKSKLIVVKGNCDSEVDQMISEFEFVDNSEILLDGLKIYATHGHKYNKDNMPQQDMDIFLYGHFHVGFVEKINGVIVANPSSASLPKENNVHGYIIIEKEYIILKNLENNDTLTKVAI